ncbi:MAG: NosR/NirI family protein [Rhodospirillales bacterium]|nr:NosR/NirI family protein [Rhodospirillales bacterium]
MGYTLVILLATLSSEGRAASLDELLAKGVWRDVFPSADSAGGSEGHPPAAPVFSGNEKVGYLFLTSELVKSVGYSGKPVETLVGLNLKGIITGAKVIEHHEPILILGIPESDLSVFLRQYKGMDIGHRVRVGTPDKDELGLDGISGASITSLVFNDSILRSARMVARTYGIVSEIQITQSSALDMDFFEEKSWLDLLNIGGLSEIKLNNAQVDAKLRQSIGITGGYEGEDGKAPFIELYTGLFNPAIIGQNLFGLGRYSKIIDEEPRGSSILFVAGHGLYGFRGYTYRNTGYFDRIRLVQGDKVIRLTREMHRPIRKAIPIAKAPSLRAVSLFVLPPEAAFDPAEPWRIELLVERDFEDQEKAHAVFPLIYDTPDWLISGPRKGDDFLTATLRPFFPHGEEPVWFQAWENRLPEIVTLCVILALLLTMLFFQDILTKYGRFSRIVRTVFLAVTFGFIGMVANAQLSVINIVTFVNSLLTGFSWGFFLLEPLIFLLWGFVAVALLFWGRGVFCGWLCPFGALQGLLHRISVIFRIKQIPIPFVVHERLASIKYVLFLVLFALSLGPLGLAGAVSEVEPFKTSITLKFVREWPFILYAVILLFVSLFIHRFFCRYLCPLGAALAIPAKNNMFDWLKRRHQCGVDCHICETKCPVQAIHPDGQINAHECIYCLNCQNIYHDDQRCPPLIDARKRLEERRDKHEKRRAELAAQTEISPGE